MDISKVDQTNRSQTIIDPAGDGCWMEGIYQGVETRKLNEKEILFHKFTASKGVVLVNKVLTPINKMDVLVFSKKDLDEKLQKTFLKDKKGDWSCIPDVKVGKTVLIKYKGMKTLKNKKGNEYQKHCFIVFDR